MRKGLKIGARHDTPSRLRWLSTAEGQKFMVACDSVPTSETENPFSTFSLPHDPIACVSRAYQEQLLTNALYGHLSCHKDLATV